MIRAASIAAVISFAAIAAACSAPAAPVDSSATTPAATATAAPATPATPVGSSPAITFTDPGDAGTTTLPTGDAAITGGACTPQAATPPAVAWKAPHALHRNVCTPQEAAAIVSCFVQNQNCYVPVSSACHQCAVSGDSTAYSSALIVHDQQPNLAPELNVEGCVGALAGDTSANGCGPKLAAKYQCEAASCTGCADATSYQTCATSADNSTCATANTAAACAAPYVGQCVQGTTELEVAYNLVKVFCGP